MVTKTKPSQAQEVARRRTRRRGDATLDSRLLAWAGPPGNNGKPREAPGKPGAEPRWASSAKDGVGTALCPTANSTSLVWFTLGHGILTEIFYPRIDQACTRDLGLIVTDGNEFFSEERVDAEHQVEHPVEGVPLYRLVNTCRRGRYRIEKTIFAHPHQDAVLQITRFTPLEGRLDDYHLYALLAPHLGNRGANNTAWLGDAFGSADAVRRAGPPSPGPGLLGPLAQGIGRLCRVVRRLAGPVPAQAADLGVRSGRGRQRRASRARWTSAPAAVCSRWPWASDPTRPRPAIAPWPA